MSGSGRIAGESRLVQLLVLSVSTASANYSQAIFSPLQEAIRAALLLSDNQLALLQGLAMAVPIAMIGIPIGRLVDRSSRVRILRVFALVSVIGAAATAASVSFTQLFLSRCLSGLVSPATAMVAVSLIADLFGPSERGRALMALGICQVAGFSGAFALGGLTLGLLGSEHWRAAVLWSAVPLILVLTLTLCAREPRRTDVREHVNNTRGALGLLWGYRAMVIPLLAGVVLVGLVDTASVIWATPVFSRQFGAGPERIGGIVAGGLLTAGIVGPLVGGALADFAQRNQGPQLTLMLLAGLAGLSAIAGVFALMPNVLWAGLLLALFMTIGTAISITGAPLATILIPNEIRGLYVSVVTAVSAPICLGVSPLLVSGLSAVLGGPSRIGVALSVVCVTASMAGACVFWRARAWMPVLTIEQLRNIG